MQNTVQYRNCSCSSVIDNPLLYETLPDGNGAEEPKILKSPLEVQGQMTAQSLLNYCFWVSLERDCSTLSLAIRIFLQYNRSILIMKSEMWVSSYM